MKGLWMGLVVGMVSLFSIGCASGQKHRQAALADENQKLKSALAERDAQLRSAQDPSKVQQLQSELAAREAKIKELEGQLRRPEAGQGADPQIAGIETSYDRKKGELTVNLPSDVLFGSGSADLKASSKATLDKVVAALRKDYPGKAIRVEGYTDADPINRTRNLWKDNEQLSEARASAVAKYLAEKGVNRTLIAQNGFGEAKPKATKALSRRVEIVVVVG